MPRISMVPDTARATADVLRAADGEVQQISTAILSTPCIEMPRDIGARFEAVSQQVARALRSTATDLGEDSEYLKARALLFEHEDGADGEIARWLDRLMQTPLGAGLARTVIDRFGRAGATGAAGAGSHIQGPQKISNDAIARAAEAVPTGTQGGQCLKWVGDLLTSLIGPSWTGLGLNDAKYQEIWGQRAAAVPIAEVRPGDIIQFDAPNVHTAIVTGQPPNYTLSESNVLPKSYVYPDESGTVSHSRLLADVVAKRPDYKIWRVGTVP